MRVETMVLKSQALEVVVDFFEGFVGGAVNGGCELAGVNFGGGRRPVRGWR